MSTALHFALSHLDTSANNNTYARMLFFSSAFSFSPAASVCYSNCAVSDRKALQRVGKTDQRINSSSSPAIEAVQHKRCLRRACSIVRDTSHPVHRPFAFLPSGRCYRSLRSRTSRLRNSRTVTHCTYTCTAHFSTRIAYSSTCTAHFSTCTVHLPVLHMSAPTISTSMQFTNTYFALALLLMHHIFCT